MSRTLQGHRQPHFVLLSVSVAPIQSVLLHRLILHVVTCYVAYDMSFFVLQILINKTEATLLCRIKVDPLKALGVSVRSREVLSK